MAYPDRDKVVRAFERARSLRAPKEARFDQAMRYAMPGRGAFFSSNSDSEIDDIFDETAIVARIEEHLAAGADHVCLQPVTSVRPLTDGPDHSALDVLRRLAPALRDAGLLA